MTHEPLRQAGAVVDPDLADVLAAQVDRAAFGALYRRYLDRVYGYCYYLLGDHHDAEDVTERTFMAALAAIDGYRDEGASFRSWLFRIAHNQLVNALRSRRRRRASSLDEVVEPVSDADPAGFVGMAEESRRLRRALDALPEDRRQVVVLRFVDGLSAREIGAVLGRSEGAVRVLQHRALRQLAEILGP
ncbi:MAG TPA: RNA polymerase sigma factor [Candidatus Limnocylindria bacterium]|nr:RNA polymerase sigma factor [Candidatus Limnocylindria bacterium]